eukprot:6294454-Prymnesium_polylepis.1
MLYAEQLDMLLLLQRLIEHFAASGEGARSSSEHPQSGFSPAVPTAVGAVAPVAAPALPPSRAVTPFELPRP